jgi:hypothetical protein
MSFEHSHTSRRRPARLSIALALLVGLTTAGLAALPATPAEALLNQVECASATGRTKAVLYPDHRDTIVDYYASKGFDAVPLLATTVEVGGSGPSCLVATFSATAMPRDNAVAFQVRVDGVPMQGHLGGLNGVQVPAVADPRESIPARDRMVSFTSFAQVRPGTHRVEVLFASCCSESPPTTNGPLATVSSPVLVLHHN